MPAETRAGDPIATRSRDQVVAALREADVEQYAQEQILRLFDHAKAEGLSIKAAAELVHYSPSVISQVLTATYPANYVRFAKNVDRWFTDQENLKIFGGCRDFARTQIATALWKIFEKTRYSRAIQIVQSPEQLGKSTAAREYTAAHNSGRTILVKLQPGGTSNPFGVFLRDLGDKVGVETQHGKIINVRMGIRRELEVCDLVIVDEFHLITHWPEKAVRDLLDYLRTEIHADGQRGVVLIATDSDVLTILQEFRRRTKYNLGQLLGRMAHQSAISLRSDEIPFDDVKLLVERYFKPRQSTLKKLYDLATRPGCGHFGALCALLADAWSDSKLDKVDITDEMVLAKAEEKIESMKRANH